MHLLKAFCWIIQMLRHVVGEYRIESIIRKWKFVDAGDFKAYIRYLTLSGKFPRQSNRAFSHVYAGYLARSNSFG